MPIHFDGNIFEETDDMNEGRKVNPKDEKRWFEIQEEIMNFPDSDNPINHNTSVFTW